MAASTIISVYNMLVLIGKHNRLSPYARRRSSIPCPNGSGAGPSQPNWNAGSRQARRTAWISSFEDRFRDPMQLKPSEYWRRQCKAIFQFDPIGTKLVD